MSNERPMVRSPSAWHAPAPPPDSLYNFMSANHKNVNAHHMLEKPLSISVIYFVLILFEIFKLSKSIKLSNI